MTEWYPYLKLLRQNTVRMENDSIENCATIGGGFLQTDACDYACASVLFQLVDKREKEQITCH